MKDEIRIQDSQFKKGSVPWNKGTKGLMPKYWLGKKRSEEVKEKISKSKLGSTSWNAGKKCPQLAGENHWAFGKKRDDITGSKNISWKGNNVRYDALHRWVTRHRGKASECVHCETKEAKRFEWANISQEYKRDLQDWMSLCTKCHHKYDNIKERSWVTRRQSGH